MNKLKYRKKKDQFVTAVQLSLETEGFDYTKWGGKQRCSAGDWLVDNNGDCYTVSKESFSKTYRKIVPGQFLKVTPVWAYQADSEGAVRTKEGSTEYKVGDFVVSNSEDGSDDYAVSRKKFENMYELVESL